MELKAVRQERKMTLRETAAALGCGRETLRRYELPPHHPDARVPDRATMARIFAWSGGRVRPDDFHDLPELTADETGAAVGGAEVGDSPCP